MPSRSALSTVIFLILSDAKTDTIATKIIITTGAIIYKAAFGITFHCRPVVTPSRKLIASPPKIETATPKAMPPTVISANIPTNTSIRSLLVYPVASITPIFL